MNKMRALVVVGFVLVVVPKARAAEWTASFPPGSSIPDKATNDRFWPYLLERLCTDSKGVLRTDRDRTCKQGGAAGPSSDPKAAERDVIGLLNDAITNSVQVHERTTKIIALKNQALAKILAAVQPANDANAGTQGSPAQSDAVPSIQPVSQTGTNVAVAGTPAGTRVVASIAVNPAGMLTTSTPSADQASQVAGTKATRLADLSIVVPINPAGSTSGTGGLGSFDYIGVRLRVNATPIIKDTLYQEAQDKVVKMFQQALDAGNSIDDQTEPLLASYDVSGCAVAYTGAGATPGSQCSAPVGAAFATKLQAATACAEAVITAKSDAIESLCGKPLSLAQATASEAALHSALTTLRDQYDADYVGLDARYDFGDPTFSMRPEARGSHLLAALAAGHRFLFNTDPSTRRGFFGLKARAGYQWTSLNNNTDKASSLDYAVGIELGAINDLQVFKLSVGAEGRHTWQTNPTDADTNFVDIKIGVEIPQSDGTRLGALLSLPADGTHGTILSLVGNWNALTGALAGPSTGGSP